MALNTSKFEPPLIYIYMKYASDTLCFAFQIGIGLKQWQ